MGRKLDALLRRTFKPYKLKAHLNLAISRLSVFKKQRQVRCNQAHSDVVQLLQLGHHDRALLRVELVIREQNMLDVFVMLEGYCSFVIERIYLIGQERICPDEMREAVAGLICASSRCGEFPELLEIRAVFMSRFGKDFVDSGIELRNKCGVNPQMIHKLSTRMPSLENRMDMLKKIATQNNILLQLEEPSHIESNISTTQNQLRSELSTNSHSAMLGDNVEIDDEFCEAMSTRNYKDVADAAEAAFRSAAYAAAAARAAVELFRSESHDPDDPKSPSTSRGQLSEHESENMEIDNENEDIKSKHSNILISDSSLDYAEDINVSETPIHPSSMQIEYGFSTQSRKLLNIDKKPISLRTRQVRGY